MKSRMTWCGALSLVFLWSTSAWAQQSPATQRGAVLGGLTGAIAGAVIGENSGEAGAGAAIGGAIGALSGAVLGNARDQEMARYQYQQQRQARAYRQQAVSLADVINMCRGGLSEAVIINQIQQRGVAQRLEVNDIIYLHQNGVSDVVITAMQQASVGPAPPPAPATYSPPPVIVEKYYVAPHYVPVAPRYYYRPHPHRHHRHSSASLNIRF